MVRLKPALRRSLIACLSVLLFSSTFLSSTTFAETHYLYDDLGRLVLVAYPDGSAVGYEYDADGNILAVHQWATDELVVNAFSPTSGPAGTQVTISGSGFHPTASQNTVMFGGAPGSVSSTSGSTLVVAVPLGAQSGPISVATGGDNASSSESFVVLKPTIASFSPAVVNSGDPVVLDGVNLNLDPGSTSISVAGAATNVDSITNTQIVFDAPDISGLVVVDTSYGQATSSSYLTVVPASIEAGDIVDVSTLETGTPESLLIGQSGKYGIFGFDAVEGQWLGVRIASINTDPAATDVSYELFSPSGTSLLSGSISSSIPTVIHLPKIATTGHYLMSFVFEENTSVEITAELELYPPLSPSGVPTNVENTVAGQVDRFIIPATAGDNLSLALTDLTVSVGSAIQMNVDRPSGGTWKSMYCYTFNNPGCSMQLPNAPETGDYAVRIVPSSSAIASYSLSLSHHVDAGTLALDTPKTISVAVPGQRALAQFTATAGQTVALGMDSISTTPSGRQVSMKVYDSSGSQIASVSDASNATFNLTELPADTYTVLLSPSSAATGTVQVTLAGALVGTIPDDGTSQTFSTTVPDQNGYFTFAATTGDNLSLGLTDLSVSYGSTVRIYVYLPSGSEWKDVYCYTSSNPGCSVEMRNAPETGQYSVRIAPAGDAMASYALMLSHHVDAGTLALDTPKTISVAVPGQRALAQFTATAGQTVALGMDSISTTPSGRQVSMKVYDSSGVQIGSVNDATNATLNLPGLPADIYTVLLTPYSAAAGQVRVVLANGLTAALPSDGTSQGFSTTVPGQNGYFTFSATAGDNLSLGLTDLSVSYGSTVRIYVYLPSGSEWKDVYCYTSSNPGCSIEMGNAPETGQYSVRIVRADAMVGYTLTVSHHVDAGTLPLGTPQTISTVAPGQHALLNFVTTSNQTVALSMRSISTTPAGKQVQMSVYDSGGSQIASTNHSSQATLNLTSLPTDTYTVLLSPYDGATATVEVELQ